MADRCYCIFEGGGAKGIAHVGALAALERSGLQLAGFAGTSAGAIVAALAAAGYTAEELFGTETESETSILDLLDCDASNVWGFDAHRPIATPPRLLGYWAWLGIRLSGGLLKFGLFVAAVLLLLSSGLLHWLNFNSESTEFAIQLTLVILLVLLPLYIVFPLASLKGVARAINQAMALKIKRTRNPAPITFADLARAGRPPLKIVATDISRRTLAVFSADVTPDVAVGDAVAASICLPGIFRPWRVGSNLHYDGGLLSNLPVWAFDAERAVDRDAWTAAIEIADKLEEGAPRGYGILASTISTALFGSGSLNTRGVERLRSISLKVKLNLLQFNMGRSEARAVIEGARDECWAKLVSQIDGVPRQIGSTCERIAKDCRALIQVAREAEGKATFMGHLRAALLFPVRGEPDVLLIEFDFGYSDYPDERLKIPIHGSFAGETWRDNIIVFADNSSGQLWEQQFGRVQDRWPRKLCWHGAQWALHIPYNHAPSNSRLVLVIDSDQPIGVDDIRTTLSSLIDQTDTILRTGIPTEAFRWL